jgi:hypothetical protein
MRFWNSIGYHDYEGLALELDEQARLVHDLAAKAMILQSRLARVRSIDRRGVRSDVLPRTRVPDANRRACRREKCGSRRRVAEKVAGQFRPCHTAKTEWKAPRMLDKIDPSCKYSRLKTKLHLGGAAGFDALNSRSWPPPLLSSAPKATLRNSRVCGGLSRHRWKIACALAALVVAASCVLALGRACAM